MSDTKLPALILLECIGHLLTPSFRSVRLGARQISRVATPNGIFQDGVCGVESSRVVRGDFKEHLSTPSPIVIKHTVILTVSKRFCSRSTCQTGTQDLTAACFLSVEDLLTPFSLALYTGPWPWVLILCVFSPSESIQGLGLALWSLGLPSHE